VPNGERIEWPRLLAHIAGTEDQELLVCEHLAAENRIVRGQLKGRLRLSEGERATLDEIGRRLGRKALGEVATAARTGTILGWYRRLVARNFDGGVRHAPGQAAHRQRPRGADRSHGQENRSWGYDPIVGALVNLCLEVSDQAVCNVLRRHRRANELRERLAEAKTRLRGGAEIDLQIRVILDRYHVGRDLNVSRVVREEHLYKQTPRGSPGPYMDYRKITKQRIDVECPLITVTGSGS